MSILNALFVFELHLYFIAESVTVSVFTTDALYFLTLSTYNKISGHESFTRWIVGAKSAKECKG